MLDHPEDVVGALLDQLLVEVASAQALLGHAEDVVGALLDHPLVEVVGALLDQPVAGAGTGIGARGEETAFQLQPPLDCGEGGAE